MKKIILVLTIVFTFNSCGVFLQNSAVKNYKFKERINYKNLNKYQYDFMYLTKLLDEGYPLIDSVFPQELRERKKIEILNNLSNSELKDADFLLQTRKYLSHFKNQHTWISSKLSTKKVYPFITYVSNSEWHLLNLDKRYDSLFIGKKISSMNGIDISEVERKLIDFTFGENKISQQQEVNKLQIYNKPLYLKDIGVIKTESDNLKIEFIDGTSLKIASISVGEEVSVYTVRLKSNELTRPQRATYDFQIFDSDDYGYLQFNRMHDQVDVNDVIGSYVKPWLQPMARGYVNRQFKKEKPAKRFARYHNAKHPIFKDFAQQLVDSLNSNKINNLIIDLRYSGGGNLMLGLQLMYYLTEETNLKGFSDYAYTSKIYKHYFTEEYEELKLSTNINYGDNALILLNENNNLFTDIRDSTSVYHISANRRVYKGTVYVLANQNTASASALLTTLLQDNNMATVIGTSVGNNPIGATSYAPMKLPKTKFNISIAPTYKIRPKPSNGKYLIPDYWIEYQLNDLLNGTDPYLDKVFDLIKAKYKE
jgi:C-terminal processing protease CtpA/Prc